MRFLFIGGDQRMLRLAELCRSRGHRVDTLGLVEEDERACAVEAPDAVVFPYPFAVREGSVPCLSGLTLTVGDALKRARGRVVAGAGLEGADYRLHEDEILLRVNSELSAEGAISALMSASESAIWGMRCVVTGYGRLARALARKLTALGAWVVVAARSEDARRLARSDGMSAEALSDLPALLQNRDTGALFNTIPTRVIDREALSLLPESCLLIELASAPYGFDREEAERMGRRTLSLPGIPGRYAPMSAAEALYNALMRAMREAVCCG